MSFSNFSKPQKPSGLTFMIVGPTGVGKTRFALGLSRLTNKPVAVLSTRDRGMAFYGGDPVFGDFVLVEMRNLVSYHAAVKELAIRLAAFGGVIVDSVTELRKMALLSDVQPHESNDYRLRDHEKRIVDLQELGLHVVLTADTGECESCGATIDDPAAARHADVLLRMFAKKGRVYAEVLKDRTGRFVSASVVEDPCIEFWLGQPASAAPKEHPLEPLARELIDHLGEINSADTWVRWRRKHAKTLAALFRSLPDSPTKRKLIAIGRAKKAQFEKRK